MIKYIVERNVKYDYQGQSYSSLYPNLHRYPATMIPQIGIDILKEFKITNGEMLDPYCGSGSSFICGLECGLQKMTGFDINPLAVLISNAKFTKLDLREIDNSYNSVKKNISNILNDNDIIQEITLPKITNMDFWFSKSVVRDLSIIKYCIEKIGSKGIQNLFFVPFSEVVKVSSNAKKDEFKLVRKKIYDSTDDNYDVINNYLKKLYEVINIYKLYYYPKLSNSSQISIVSEPFYNNGAMYDVVLTSPPYGDSRTTVAYGQFSALTNEWLGMQTARKIDSYLMGGKPAKETIKNGIIAEPISQIEIVDKKRALEVSSFYYDLEKSIKTVARNVNNYGKTIYIVGNRKVKNVELPTDQFIAEKFEEAGFKHIITYKRALSNKVMPSRNSPTNETGKTVNTMLFEYIVISEKNEQ